MLSTKELLFMTIIIPSFPVSLSKYFSMQSLMKEGIHYENSIVLTIFTFGNLQKTCISNTKIGISTRIINRDTIEIFTKCE